MARGTQRAPGIEPRGNHARVVEHQQIARIEQRRKLGELRIAQGAGGAVHRPTCGSGRARRGLLARSTRGADRSRSRQRAAPLMPWPFLKWSRARRRARSMAALSSWRLGSKSSGGKIGGDVRPLRPTDADAREGLGDQKAVPGAHDPGVLGLQMKGADGRAGHLRQLDGAHLGLVDGAARAVGGKDGGAAALDNVPRPSSPSRAPRELEPRTASKPNSLRMRVISSPSKLWLMRMTAWERRK